MLWVQRAHRVPEGGALRLSEIREQGQESQGGLSRGSNNT